MSAYSYFAKVYDIFMDDIPYEQWAELIGDYLIQNGLDGAKILDAGCGTGTFTKLLYDKGFDIRGFDLSSEMAHAAGKKYKNITFFTEDMRSFQTNEQYDAVVSVCDSMNYLLDTDELLMTFNSVSQALKPGGLFIFDMKTFEFFKSLGENIYNDEKDIGEYYWENYFDEETGDNDYYISFYIKKGKLYEKHIEEHTQHAFSFEEVEKTIKESGLTLVDNLGMDFKSKADYNEQRVYFILKKEE